MHDSHLRRRRPVEPSREACSACSGEPGLTGVLCEMLRQSPPEKLPGESCCAATIWRGAARGRPRRGPLQAAFSRGRRPDRLTLCRNALAFPDLIMDDKSMQSWSTMQLTLSPTPGTIFGMDKPIGRPRKPMTPTEYEDAFRRRVRNARALLTDEPKEMARALGVREDTYYRYETRTMLPHYLIPKFCQLTGVTVAWLINGPQPGQPSHTGITLQE